jgi:mannosyl-3-phosphoglycerate phosphatase
MAGDTGTTPLLVVTDLDGTLLDETTYSHAAAAEALAAIGARGASLVLATSKTRAEVAVIAASLDLPSAWIVENGGAIVLPPGFFGPDARPADTADEVIVTCAVDRATLIDALAKIEWETSARVTGFAAMTLSEIAALTELPVEAARLAAAREFDEPFIVEDDACLPSVAAAARRRGLRVTRGGRFHHLTGDIDKGGALAALLDDLPPGVPRPFTIGLGDAPNDLSLLLRVNRPIVVPRPGGHVDADLARALPKAERAPHPGPAGWNAALLTVLGGGRLPLVGS